jgi:hypothetical protein
MSGGTEDDPGALAEAAATLLETALRARYHARFLMHDPAGPQLIALAEEFEARAQAIIAG